MGKKGWIKLWRKSLDNDFCKGDVRKLGFWTWCLLKAVTEEGDYPLGNQMVHLKPGQFIFGRRRAAQETGLSESTVYKWMRLLQKSNNVRNNVRNNHYSVITIIKWDSYQGQEKNGNNDGNNVRNRNAYTIKEEKKNSEKNTLSYEREKEKEEPMNLYEQWLKDGGLDG